MRVINEMPSPSSITAGATSDTESIKADILRTLRRIGVWPCLSAVVLALLFVSVTLRAGRQSITGDEAFNWALFLKGALEHVFLAHYDANNHVLYTVLAWLSVHSLGLNEFNLRLPTIAAAVVFFANTFRISSVFFAKRPWHLLCTVVLAGNPYLLDFFTVARGYGLALAFFSAAIWNALSLSRAHESDHRRLFRIGIWSALAVCSQLTFLFPVLALFGALALALFRGAESPAKEGAALAANLLRLTFGPFVVLSFCVLVMPLRTATKASFYVGASGWLEMTNSLLEPSLFHNLRAPFLMNSPDTFWLLYGYFEKAVLPLLALAILVCALACLFRRERNWGLTLSSLTFVFLMFGLWCSHALLGLKLPVMRTGVYLLFLFPLCFFALLALTGKSAERRLGLVLSPIWILLALCYARQCTPRATWDWRYDASTREFARTIDILRAGSNLHGITIGGSWIFEPALNFYRQKNGYTEWRPVVRQKPADPADFYLLVNQDRSVVANLHLRILIDDPNSGAVLAVPEHFCTK